MSHARDPHLREKLDEIAPRLDYVLTEGPLNTRQHMGEFSELPQSLKRRGGVCVATSWLLANELRKDGVYASPYVKNGPVRLGDRKWKTIHVIDRLPQHDGRYVDATSQQYYSYVGLKAHDAIANPDLADLYPENTIAIIDPKNTEFQEEFAVNAHRIEKELASRGITASLLAGTTLDEKIDVFKQVWNPNHYKPLHPPHFDLGVAVMQSAMLMDRYELIR